MPSPYGNINTGTLDASVFQGLRQYQAHNKLRRAGLQLLARDLLEHQVQELRDAFMALDSQGDGLLSPEELAEGARRVDCELGEEEPEQLVAMLGGYACGHSSGHRAGYKEFISALVEQHVEFDREQLSEAFRQLDADGTGRITYEDMERVLAVQVASGAQIPAITKSEWEEIAAPHDRSGGGNNVMLELALPELTFEEFLAVMQDPAGSEVSPGIPTQAMVSSPLISARGHLPNVSESLTEVQPAAQQEANGVEVSNREIHPRLRSCCVTPLCC